MKPKLVTSTFENTNISRIFSERGSKSAFLKADLITEYGKYVCSIFNIRKHNVEFLPPGPGFSKHKENITFPNFSRENLRHV
jgi:hypothetical protein